MLWHAVACAAAVRSPLITTTTTQQLSLGIIMPQTPPMPSMLPVDPNFEMAADTVNRDSDY